MRLQRVKRVLKRVGETCTIVVCFAPVIVYVYSYVLKNGICNKNVNDCAKWFDVFLTEVPPSPLPGMYVSAIWHIPDMPVKPVFDPRLKIQIFGLQKIRHQKFHIITNVSFVERVKDFFEKPPQHDLHIGDLVTCTCHGGVAVVIDLFDKEVREQDPGVDYPRMNMARIWWISMPNKDMSRDWVHTIGRLNKYKGDPWSTNTHVGIAEQAW